MWNTLWHTSNVVRLDSKVYLGCSEYVGKPFQISLWNNVCFAVHAGTTSFWKHRMILSAWFCNICTYTSKCDYAHAWDPFSLAHLNSLFDSKSTQYKSGARCAAAYQLVVMLFLAIQMNFVLIETWKCWLSLQKRMSL